MSELVRSTVGGTIQLLFGLLANPEAIDKFTGFFDRIRERQFVMTVNDGKHNNERFGTVVTLTVYDGQGQFELLQGFLPVAEAMYQSTGKRYFTDFFEPEFGSVVQIPTDDLGLN